VSPPFSLSCTGPVCISGVFVVLTLFLRKSTEHLYFQRQTNSSMEQLLSNSTASMELFYCRPLNFLLIFSAPDTSLEVDLRDFMLAFYALSCYAPLYTRSLCVKKLGLVICFINESLLQLVFV